MMLNNYVSMFKTSWRIFKKNKFVVNSMVVAATAISLNSFDANAQMPQGGQYVHGKGDINSSGNLMNIDQHTRNGIVNWQRFSIGNGNTVNINNGAGATLNRVIGNDVSKIHGQLNATGSAYLINQNGVVVGPQGQVITGGNFVASTLDVSNGDYLNKGATSFKGDGNHGNVLNLGKISTGGDAILLGKNVLNQGTIRAGGDALVGAGDEILLTDRTSAGDRIYVQVADNSRVTNKGLVSGVNAELKAAGGNMYALAINNEGTVRARHIKNEGGKIVLKAAKGTVENKGTLDASNKYGNGGSVTVTGDRVALRSGSSIDVRGKYNGGEAYVGGGYQGKNKAIKNATYTTVEENAKIYADSQYRGNGGKVIVWSDNTTDFSGTVSATGGKVRGNGGFVEISGKKNLNIASLDVDLSANNGSNGELLLDPENIVVIDDEQGVQGDVGSATQLVDSDVEDFLQNSGSMSIQTASAGEGDGDVDFQDGVSVEWDTNSQLTVNAIRDINLEGTTLDASANDGNASINLLAGRNITFKPGQSGETEVKTGSQGTLFANAAGGNWQNGTGSIDIAEGTNIKSYRMIMQSGKNFDGSRTDIAPNMDIASASEDGAFGGIILNGFDDVNLDFGGENNMEDVPLDLNANETIKTDSSSIVVNAKNINVSKNLESAGDLVLVAAAFDDETNNFVASDADSFNPALSDGWKTEKGTISFDSDVALNAEACCGVELRSGLNEDGSRNDLTSSELTFSYGPDKDSYKFFGLKGFKDIEIEAENNSLKSDSYVDLYASNTINLDEKIESDDVRAISELDINLTSDADIDASNNATFVVDEKTPFSPGAGAFKMADGAEIDTGERLAIYSSVRSQNNIDGKLNGVDFAPGEEFVDTDTEQWEVFYQNKDTQGDDPYVVYYKNSPSNITVSIDCESNPEQAGCEDYVEYLEQGKSFRVALAEDNVEREGAMMQGDSAKVRNNEFYVINDKTRIASELNTRDQLNLMKSIPLAALNVPLSTVAAFPVPGLQGVAQYLSGITTQAAQE